MRISPEYDKKDGEVEENPHELAKLVNDFLFPAVFFRMIAVHRVSPLHPYQWKCCNQRIPSTSLRPSGCRKPGLAATGSATPVGRFRAGRELAMNRCLLQTQS